MRAKEVLENELESVDASSFIQDASAQHEMTHKATSRIGTLMQTGKFEQEGELTFKS